MGISQGANKEVYRFICLLGLKILFLPAAILVGSILGGYIAGVLLGVPCHISVISAGGMSYYSITGAFMTEAYGLEVGAYGFLVNVMREFFTVLFVHADFSEDQQGQPHCGRRRGEHGNYAGSCDEICRSQVRAGDVGDRHGADICGAVFAAADGGGGVKELFAVEVEMSGFVLLAVRLIEGWDSMMENVGE